MVMAIVTDLGDLIWDMEAAEQVRILMDYTAVVRAWAMEEVLMVVVTLVECTHPAMVVIISLVAVTLEVALTHQCTLAVVRVEAVIWVQVVLAHTIEI